MTLEPWLHFLHIGSAAIWLGGGITLSLVGLRARQSGNIVLIGEFARTLPFVGLRALTPAVIVLLVTGVWLVFAEYSGDFSQLWIWLALAAFFLAFLIGVLYLSRTAGRLERAVSGPVPDLGEARAAVTRWMVGYSVVLLTLVFALWDMVFKPL